MPSDLISVIIPVYNNENNLKTTYHEIKEALAKNNYNYEIIFIDDGSVDKSFSILESIASNDSNVVVLKLTRNFGQHSATLAGIKHSKGDIIITIDADLQNNPIDILRLIKKLKEGYQVVSGCRDVREVSLLNRLRSRVINWCIYYISGAKLKDSTSTFKAYSRDIIDYALNIEHYMKFLPVYVCWIGSRITEIDVEYRARKTGKSQYNLIKLFVLFVEWLLLFSSGIKTVILLLIIGFFFMLIGSAFFITYMISPKSAEGVLLIYALFSFFGGINFAVLGILAERVKQLQNTVNKQPLYVIDTTISGKK